ncbi:MAG: hypothetical protein SNG49_00580 [Rikenellaceae bacterium]
MDRKLWLSSTKSILIGVKLYYICNLVAAVLGLSFLSLVPVIGPLGKMAAGASVVGAFAFLYGIKEFKDAVHPADLPSVNKLHTSITLIICGIFIKIIPVIGWIITPIIYFIASTFMLLAYRGLKNSTTMGYSAKNGAAKLYTAMILSCVAAIFSIIPLVGGVIAALLDIGVLVLVLGGWKLIAEEPVELFEPIEAFEYVEE